MHYLTGNTVSKTNLQTLSEEFGFKLWPSETDPFLLNKMPKQTFPENLSVLVGAITEKKLNSLFTFPISFIIDVNSQIDSIRSFFTHQARNQLDETLGVLLTCPVIYASDVAQIFTEALHQRLHFSSNRYSGIHMAIHEALVNGLVHGNLQLSSALRQSARDFIDYAHILNERLTDPAYANKSISIWATWNQTKLEIKVRDEGAGYTLVTHKKNHTSHKRSGRGLCLIAGTADSCTIDDFGREITLSFILNEHEENIQHASSVIQRTISETDLSNCQILVIEDNPSNQILVSQLLNVAGIVNIETAQDGIEGLQKAFQLKPDLIILDITMPRMNGYEVLHQLKIQEETSNIPILIQTASDTRAARDKTFSSGATDFITKPVNPLEFFSRIKVHLENRLLVKRLENKLKQIDEELCLAQKMQESLLPTQKSLIDIHKNFNLDIAFTFKPSSHLGGDFWQMIPISKHKIAFYVCDFSGHGVSSAMNTFRLHTLIGQMKKSQISIPSDFLGILNNKLYKLLPRGQFATFFFGIIDVKKETLTYSGAGSPFPFLITHNSIQNLDTSGLPLGISPNASYINHQIPFTKKMSLFIFSDSLIEQQNSKGERLNYQSFLNLIKPSFDAPTSQEVINKIMENFYTFSSNLPCTDDITAVFIRGTHD